MRVYLAGAIEKTKDGGATWRQEITPKLEAIGCEVFDPCVHTDGGLVVKELGWGAFNFPAWGNLRRVDPHEYYRVGRLVRKEDLIEVARSDLVIVRMNKDTTGSFGTCGEMTLASFLRVPVYVFYDAGVTHYDVPAWMMWCADELFNCQQDLLEKLLKIQNKEL